MPYGLAIAKLGREDKWAKIPKGDKVSRIGASWMPMVLQYASNIKLNEGWFYQNTGALLDRREMSYSFILGRVLCYSENRKRSCCVRLDYDDHPDDEGFVDRSRETAVSISEATTAKAECGRHPDREVVSCHPCNRGPDCAPDATH